VIASHYAEPVERSSAKPAVRLAGPSQRSEMRAQICAGARFRMLDNSLGWAWGYAGEDGRVGYVRSEAVA
jgi:hypothetical protein